MQGRLAAGVIPGREAALLALVEHIDRTSPTDAVSMAGPCLGAPTALWMCLNGPASLVAGDASSWAAAFLAACRELEAARLVLRFADAGEMRLAVDRAGAFDAWIAGDRIPSLWLERADIAAWAASVSREPWSDRLRGPGSARFAAATAHQLPYPADGTIGGLPVSACRDVLAMVMERAGSPSNADGGPVVLQERDLVARIIGTLGLAPEAAGRIVSAFTLDAKNAGWHAVLPGGPMAPLVRLGGDRLACCRRGLETEPLFFLARELRRRHPERYHNGAQQREDAFRSDLYARFAERRFVTSPGRIVLRRDDRRNRTDVDAAIFDRKTGTLALFELKSQDPFARRPEELERQRENLRRAGHQAAAVLDWVNRNGADEVLNRMDRATAKRFRVQRVLPFVLGRYLADAGGGQSVRIAWGSWGQVVDLLESIEGGNPLLSLHDRLIAATRTVPVPLPAWIRVGKTGIAVRGGWEA